MRLLIVLLLFINSLVSVAQLDDKTIYDLKSGRVLNDISYVYWLPVQKGKKCFLIQAYNSKMSHRNELSLDFKMKKGTRIYAVRDGVVEEIKADSDEGGLGDKYLSKGNHIIIRHNDGSKAMYWHLQKDGVMVKPGELVTKGQYIGLSGNTGYTAFPHLHFEVIDKNDRQIPTRFLTKKGIRYLRPANWYRSTQD